MPPPDVPPELREAVLAWFDAEARPLAFRSARDPWAILVSEAIAQQTQAARAAAAWGAFMAAYPTAAALADASPADVLRAWRGLGYNRRALALRRAAIAIVVEHGGRVPSDLDALRRLPGVGPYTARAVAALAFGRPVGAVDTNVRRVLSRVVGGGLGTLAERDLQAVADAVVPADRPGLWTHALMDVGATFCRPRAPRCDACPAQPWCRAADRDSAAARTPGTRRRGSTPATKPRFRATARWLRGRILDALRDADDGGWVEIDGEIGEHGPAAVEVALAALARDGLAERHATDPRRARLPLA